MTSDGVTKVDLHKQPPSTVSGEQSELDKEDFQKAAQDAKESVSSSLQSAKEFMVGGSNDAENKTKEQTAQVSRDQHSDLMAYRSDAIWRSDVPLVSATQHVESVNHLYFDFNLPKPSSQTALAFLFCKFTSVLCCCIRAALGTTLCKASLMISSQMNLKTYTVNKTSVTTTPRRLQSPPRAPQTTPGIKQHLPLIMLKDS